MKPDIGWDKANAASGKEPPKALRLRQPQPDKLRFRGARWTRDFNPYGRPDDFIPPFGLLRHADAAPPLANHPNPPPSLLGHARLFVSPFLAVTALGALAGGLGPEG